MSAECFGRGKKHTTEWRTEKKKKQKTIGSRKLLGGSLRCIHQKFENVYSFPSFVIGTDAPLSRRAARPKKEKKEGGDRFGRKSLKNKRGTQGRRLVPTFAPSDRPAKKKKALLPERGGRLKWRQPEGRRVQKRKSPIRPKNIMDWAANK